jgi:hypothetical protein
MKRISFAVVAVLLLAGCATRRDARTLTEIDRDTEIWTRAHGLRIAIAPEQFKDCSSLGVVSEFYYEGPPSDPAKRPMRVAWPEYLLRFKTARLGGNAALLSSPITKWTGPLNERRVLGEAYLCEEPALRTAAGFKK